MRREPNMLALYMAHRRELVNYANGIVGDIARAEDVVQEAWLRFGTATNSRVLEEPVGYLYRIVRNLAIDSHRRRMREQNLVEIGRDARLEDATDGGPSPEATVAARDELGRLCEAMSELPERTRIALEMHRLGGTKLREIAAFLNISVPLAHQLVAEGVRHCKERLGWL